MAYEVVPGVLLSGLEYVTVEKLWWFASSSASALKNETPCSGTPEQGVSVLRSMQL